MITKNIKTYTWEDIRMCFDLFLSIYHVTYEDLTKIETLKVNNYNDSGYFYGMDWVYKKDYEKRVDWACNNPRNFLYFADCANAGTLHTAELIDKMKDNKDAIAAIYICAFYEATTGRDGHYVRGQLLKNLNSVASVAREVMNEYKLFYWHHASTRQLPQIYILELFEKIENAELQTIIELIVINIKNIVTDYRLVKYDSRI